MKCLIAGLAALLARAPLAHAARVTVGDYGPMQEGIVYAKPYSSTAIAVAWMWVGSPVDGFRVYRRPTGQSSWTLAGTVLYAPGSGRLTYSFLDGVDPSDPGAGTGTPLSASTTYEYYISAYSGSSTVKNTSLTQWSTATTLAPVYPVGLSVYDNHDGTVKLTWTANPEPNLTEYRIYRAPRSKYAAGELVLRGTVAAGSGQQGGGGGSGQWTLATQANWSSGTLVNTTAASDGFLRLQQTGWGAGAWTADLSGVPSSFNDVDMFSSSGGWAVGVGGDIYRLSGGTWTKVLATGWDLNGIEAVSASEAWAVGKSGKIYKWDGVSWTSMNSPTNNDLNSVHMLSSTEGWAVGSGDTVLRYSSGTWTKCGGMGFTCPGTGKALNAVYAITSNNVWIVGANGTVVHWNGSSWQSYTNSNWGHLYGLFMVDANNGWATGASGKILRWNGSQWTPETSGTSNQLNDVSAIDTSTAWAVGSGGTICQRSAGTWSCQSNINNYNGSLEGVHMWDGRLGWAAGASGTILRYSAPAAYASSGTAEYIFDAGTTQDWQSLSYTPGTQPAGTSVSYLFSVSDDGLNWSAPVSDITLAGNSRYLKMQISLGTTNNQVTPSLDTATVNFTAPSASPPPDSGSGTSFTDTGLNFFQDYYYIVAAVDDRGNEGVKSPQRWIVPRPPADTGFLTAAWSPPHGNYTNDTAKCMICHGLHSAPSQYLVKHMDVPNLCFTCHDGTGSNRVVDYEFRYNTNDQGYDSAGGSTHPVLRTSSTLGYAIKCTNCHSAHLNPYDSNSPKLLSPRLKEMTGKQPFFRHLGNDICYTCHGVGTPLIGGERETTFKASAHGEYLPDPLENDASGSQAALSGGGTQIQCLNCHRPHGTVNKRLKVYEEENLCFTCHNREKRFGAPDVMSLFWREPSDPDYRHDIFDEDQSFNGGSKIECTNCHNPHTVRRPQPAQGQLTFNGPTRSYTYEARYRWGANIQPHDPRPTGIWTGDYIGFCTQCHDNELPTSSQVYPWAPTLSFGSQAFANISYTFTVNDKMGFVAGNPKALLSEMGFTAGEILQCVQCHDPHGSGNVYKLREYVTSKDGSLVKGPLLVYKIPGADSGWKANCKDCHAGKLSPSAAPRNFDLRFFCGACHGVGRKQDMFARVPWPTDCTRCHRHGEWAF